jgi:hypothetical protein
MGDHRFRGLGTLSVSSGFGVWGHRYLMASHDNDFFRGTRDADQARRWPADAELRRHPTW